MPAVARGRGWRGGPQRVQPSSGRRSLRGYRRAKRRALGAFRKKFDWVDRSFQTDARAEPVRPEKAERRPLASDAKVSSNGDDGADTPEPREERPRGSVEPAGLAPVTGPTRP